MYANTFCRFVLAVAIAVLAGRMAMAGVDGRWSGDQGDVVFTQDGSAVEGEATFPNGGTAKIVGVAIGNTVHYSYVTRNGKIFGTGTMTLSDDGQELHSTYQDQRGSGEWQLRRDGADGIPTPAEVSVTGQWNSNLGPVQFDQADSQVSGSLTFVNGHNASIDGHMADRELDFTYQLSTGGRGDGHLTLSEDGNILEGTYTKQPGGQTSDFVMARAGYAPEAEPSPDSGASPGSSSAINLAGSWNSNLGNTQLQQVGHYVSGTLTFASGETASIDGLLSGHSFHFVYRLSTRGGGVGELTLSDDGNTLSGSYRRLPGGVSGEWILTRGTPPTEPASESVRDVSGRWNTNLGVVTFSQTGSSVTGTLRFANGQRAHIDGTLRDRELNFKYEHDNGSSGQGTIEVNISDPNVMKGTYRDNATGREASWQLQRA